MLPGAGQGDPSAVWGTRPVGAAPKSKPARAAVVRAKQDAKLPEYIDPHLCKSVERPPNGEGWVHEIKFDGYRVQMRVEAGRVSLRTRKGLDWAEKFGANRE